MALDDTRNTGGPLPPPTPIEDYSNEDSKREFNSQEERLVDTKVKEWDSSQISDFLKMLENFEKYGSTQQKTMLAILEDLKNYTEAHTSGAEEFAEELRKANTENTKNSQKRAELIEASQREAQKTANDEIALQLAELIKVEKAQQGEQISEEELKELIELKLQEDEEYAELLQNTVERHFQELVNQNAELADAVRMKEKDKELAFKFGEELSKIESAIANADVLDNIYEVLSSGQKLDSAFLANANKQLSILKNLENSTEEYKKLQEEANEIELKSIRTIWKDFPQKIGEKLANLEGIFSDMFGPEIVKVAKMGMSALQGVGKVLANPTKSWMAAKEQMATVKDATTALVTNPGEVAKAIREGLGMDASGAIQEKALAFQERQEKAYLKRLPMENRRDIDLTRLAERGLRPGSIYTHDIHTERVTEKLIDKSSQWSSGLTDAISGVGSEVTNLTPFISNLNDSVNESTSISAGIAEEIDKLHETTYPFTDISNEINSHISVLNDETRKITGLSGQIIDAVETEEKSLIRNLNSENRKAEQFRTGLLRLTSQSEEHLNDVVGYNNRLERAARLGNKKESALSRLLGRLKSLFGFLLKPLGFLTQIPLIGKLLTGMGGILNKGLLGKMGLVGKLGGIAALGFGAFDIFKTLTDDNLSKEEKVKGVSATGGGMAGGAIGAALGSFLGPLGTIAGGMLGTYLGKTVGSKIGDWLNEKDENGISRFDRIAKAFSKFFEDTKEFWIGLKKVFTGIVDAIKTAFGSVWSGLKKIFSGVMLLFTKPAEGIKKIFNGLTDLIKAPFILFRKLVENLGPILKKAIRAIPGLIKKGFGLLWEGLRQLPGFLWKTLKTIGPLLWEAIKGLGSLLWDLTKEVGSLIWDGIKALPGLIWEGIKGLTWLIWEGLKAIPKLIWEGIKGLGWLLWEGFKGSLKLVWAGLKALPGLIWKGIKGFWGLIWDGIKGLGGLIWDGVKALPGLIWDGIKGLGGLIWEGIKSVPGLVWDGIKGLGGLVWEGFTGLGGLIWDGIKAIPSLIWDGIKGLAGLVWDGIKALPKALWNGIKSLISKIPGFGWLAPKKEDLDADAGPPTAQPPASITSSVATVATGAAATAGAVVLANKFLPGAKETAANFLGKFLPGTKSTSEGLSVGDISKQASKSVTHAGDTLADVLKRLAKKISGAGGDVSAGIDDKNKKRRRRTSKRTKVTNAARNVTRTATESAKGLTSKAKDIAKAGQTKVAEGAKNLKDKATSVAKNATTKVTDKAKNIAEKSKDAVKTSTEKITEKAKNLAGKTTDLAKSGLGKVTGAAAGLGAVTSVMSLMDPGASKMEKAEALADVTETAAKGTKTAVQATSKTTSTVAKGAKVLGSIGKVAGAAGGVLSIGASVVSGVSTFMDPNATREEKWAAGGNMAGAAVGAAVGSFLGPLGTAIGSAVGGWVGEKVAPYAMKAWDGLKEATGKAWDSLKSVAGKAWDGIKSVGNKVKDAAGKAWDGVKNITGKAWDGLKTAAKYNPVNLAAQGLKKAGSAITSFFGFGNKEKEKSEEEKQQETKITIDNLKKMGSNLIDSASKFISPEAKEKLIEVGSKISNFFGFGKREEEKKSEQSNSTVKITENASSNAQDLPVFTSPLQEMAKGFTKIKEKVVEVSAKVLGTNVNKPKETKTDSIMPKVQESAPAPLKNVLPDEHIVPSRQAASAVMGTVPKPSVDSSAKSFEAATSELKQLDNGSTKGFDELNASTKDGTRQVTKHLADIAKILKDSALGNNNTTIVAGGAGGGASGRNIPSDIDSMGVLLTNKMWGI